MANFATLYGEVRDTGFGSTMVPRCKLWTNAAYHYICNARRWSWLQQSVNFNTVASQATYNLTGASPVVTDFAGMYELVTPAAKLVRVDAQLYDLITGAIPTATATDAVVYTIRGGATVAANPAAVVSGNNIVLGIWPATTGIRAYTARYWRGTDSIEMTADSDVPIVPARHHWAIVELACRYGLAHDDQLIASNVLMGAGMEIVQQMVAMDAALYGVDSETLEMQDTPSTPGKVNPASVINPAAIPFPAVAVES